MGTYYFQDGREEKYEEIPLPKVSEECFLINLPSEEEDFIGGNGESIWACGTTETLEAYKNMDFEGVVYVKLMNNSMYYPNLKYKTVIPVKVEKNKRPVAYLDELNYYYGESKRDELTRFLINRQMQETQETM